MTVSKHLTWFLMLALVLLAAVGTARAEITPNPLLLDLHTATFTDRGDALHMLLPPGDFITEQKDTGQQVFSCDAFHGAYREITLTMRITHIPFSDPTGTHGNHPSDRTQLNESVARYIREHARPAGTRTLRDHPLTIDGHPAGRLTQIHRIDETAQTTYDTLIILAESGTWNIEAVYTTAPDDKTIGESIESIFASPTLARVSRFKEA